VIKRCYSSTEDVDRAMLLVFNLPS